MPSRVLIHKTKTFLVSIKNAKSGKSAQANHFLCALPLE